MVGIVDSHGVALLITSSSSALGSCLTNGWARSAPPKGSFHRDDALPHRDEPTAVPPGRGDGLGVMWVNACAGGTAALQGS